MAAAMEALPFSPDRCQALHDVISDRVRFHNGLSGPALGYTWRDDAQMFQEKRDVLRELWAANAIDVETHRLFADRGHRVRLTHRGYELMCTWDGEAAA